MTIFLKILQWLYFLIYPKHLILLIMMLCYIYILCHYGIRGISNKWFFSYLSNRKQYIEMNECRSPLITLTHGVPHRSILGPGLSLNYINDISNSTSLNLLSVADDTTIYLSDCDIDNITLTLNHELKYIQLDVSKQAAFEC